MSTPSFPPGTERLRRLLFPSYGARSNAAQASAELARAGEQPLLHGPDVALLSGHAAGLSQRKAAGRLETAMWDVFPGHVALLDRNGVIVSVNRAWRQFGLTHGASATAGLGMNYLEVCGRAAAAGEPEGAEAADMVRTALSGHEDERRLAYPVEEPTGQRWFSLQVVGVPGQHSCALVVHLDITSEKAQQQRRHRASHDTLTGLPNRALLSERLERAVAGAARGDGPMAVLFVDIDAFASVNDRFGHNAGDDLLRRTARQMAGRVRSSDTLGRWGGSEFLVIAERLHGSFTADDVSRRLAMSVAAPFDVGAERLAVSLSVGIAQLQDGETADELVQRANQALHTGRAARAARAAGATRQTRTSP